jgi:hypothetical protein
MNRHFRNAHPFDDNDDDDDNTANGDSGEDVTEDEDTDDEGVTKTDTDDEGGEDEGGEDGDDEKKIWDIYRADVQADVDVGSLAEKRQYVIQRYLNDVLYYNKFRRDATHKKITATKRKFLNDADEDEELGNNEALKLAVAKRQHLIQEMSGLDSDNEPEEEDDA